MDGAAQFANNQIQLKSDGSLFAQNYLKTDFAVANYSPNNASSDVTTVTVPVAGSAAYTSLFGSSTNKYLTTQEYVDKELFKQTARLNFITKDVNAQLATFENIGKILAAMEGQDGMNPLTTMNGLVDEVQDVKLSISDVVGGGYNSILVNCVPSVWAGGAAPDPIPTPITKLYKEDGWFHSNLSQTSQIQWNLPAYSGMKIKDITNLFMNTFLLSTIKLPKITVYTAPKNNSSDAISGVYNAKIEYFFSVAQPIPVTAQRSCLHIINSPKNVYSDKSQDIKCGYSLTSNGSGAPVQTTFTSSTTFSTSFATSKVSSEDGILTFAVETSESTIKDYMLILQSFNISTKNGTTQMMFQNSSVVNDYLFKYFFRQHPDFSDVSLDSNNVVNTSNYNAYVSGTLANTIYSTPSVTNVNPQSHVTGFKSLKIGATSVISNNQIITFPAGTLSALLVCDLENNNNGLVITKNGLTITPANTVGDYSPPITLTTGNNVFVVIETDTSGDHTTTTTFTAKVLSNDTKLSSVTMNGQSITLASGAIPAGIIKNVPAGTTSVTVVGTPNLSSASVSVTGATGLVTGNNTVTVKVTAEDGNFVNNTFTVRVLSDDTRLSTFTVNGTSVTDGSTVSLSAGTTAVSAVAVPTAQSFGAVAVISGTSGLILGNNTLTVVVTAESGAMRTYRVTLKVVDSNNNLASLVINTLSRNMNETLFIFDSTTTNINVTATPESSSATVAVTGIPTTVVAGTTYILKITVTAENNVSKDYNYDVRVQSNDNTIDSVYINGLLVNFDGNNVAEVTSVATVAPSSLLLQVNEASQATLQYKVENDGQLQSITSGVAKTVPLQPNGTTQIFVTITPEDPAISSKTYTINLYSRSNNTGLSAITLTPLGGTTTSATNGQTITLASGVTSVTVDASASYSGAIVSVDGEIGTTSSSKTITVSSGTSKVVHIIVTATDGVTQNSYSVTIVAPDNTPVLNNDTSLTLLGIGGVRQTIASNIFVNIINSTGPASPNGATRSMDLDTSFVVLNPTVHPSEDPAFASQKGLAIVANPTNPHAIITATVPQFSTNEVFNNVYVNVTSSDGSKTQSYKFTLYRIGIIQFSSAITLGTSTSYQAEVTIADAINSIVLNPPVGQSMAANEIKLTAPVADGVSVSLLSSETSDLTKYRSNNRVKLEFTLDGNPTKYYQTISLIRSTGYDSLNKLLLDNDLTLYATPVSNSATNSSIVTSNINGTPNLFGYAFTTTPYILKTGPGSMTSFSGPMLYLVVSYDGGLIWKYLKYSNSNLAFSFTTSSDPINSFNFTLLADNSIVYNNNDTTVLRLRTSYFIFRKTDNYFTKSLVSTVGSASTSAPNFTVNTNSLTYINTLYVSRVNVSDVYYDYFAIVVNDTASNKIFIMAREIGSTSTLKTLSIVVQCDSFYNFADEPIVSKVIDNGTEYLQVETSGNQALANSVPSGTYGISISLLTDIMFARKYTTSTSNVVALNAQSSDTSLSSLSFRIGTDNDHKFLSLTNENQSFPVNFSNTGSIILYAGATSEHAIIDIVDSNNNSVKLANSNNSNPVSYSSNSGNIELKVKVTAQNGTVKTYTITFLVPGNSYDDLSLKTFTTLAGQRGSLFVVTNGNTTFNELSINRTSSSSVGTNKLIIYKGEFNNIVEVKVNNVVRPNISLETIQGAIFSQVSIALTSGNNKIDVTVESDEGSTYTYTLNVTA